MAVVATARNLVTIAYHVLKNNKPYRYAIPCTTDGKLARLRVKATGEKRRGGTPKGQPRHENYGTGKAERTIPSLDAIYAREGLPPISALPNGEVWMLCAHGVLQQLETTRRPQRLPRRTESAAPAEPAQPAGPAPRSRAPTPKNATARETLRNAEVPCTIVTPSLTRS